MVLVSVTIHTAPWLLTGRGDPIRHGAVVIADTHIAAVGPLTDVRRRFDDTDVVEWQGVLIPGLVNAHTHLQYSGMADIGTRGYASFEEWSEVFEQSYEAANSLADGWRPAAAAGLRAMLASGTTAAGDVVTHAEALDVLRTGGLHGVAYWEVMAWHAPDWTDRGRAATLRLLEEQGATGDAAVGLSPHAPYSLDTEVLRDLGTLSRRRGLRSHLHLAESAAEHDFVAHGSGALAEQWRAWGFGGFELLRRGGVNLSAVSYAESVAALGPDTHIAHGIYVDADDRATLRRHSTAVALCPRSNAALGLAEAPVADYLREGNIVAVGTDSLSSSPSLDVLADTASLYRIARSQGYHESDLHRRLFAAVTEGGAAALGMSHRIGTLEPGKLADFAVLEVDARRGRDVLATIVEAGEGSAIGTVIAGTIRFDRAGERTPAV